MMTEQSMSRAMGVESGLLKRAGSLIAVPAAVVLLAAFFLPWFSVLSQGTALGEASGLEILNGIEDAALKELGPAFDASANASVVILPIVAVGALLMAAFHLATHKASGWAAAIYLVTGLLGLASMFFTFARIQIDLTEADRVAKTFLSFEYHTGWWLSYAASFVLVVAAYLVFRTESQVREKPWVVKVVRGVRTNSLQLGIVGVLVVLWLAFIAGSPSTFLNQQIYRALMTSIPYWGIIALPLTMVVIAGDIDLSFPSTMAVGMVAFFEIYTRQASLGLAFAGSLIAGFLVGLLNGLIVVRIGIPPLIATIGTQFFWRGLVEVIRAGQGESMVFTRDTALRNMLVHKVMDYFPAQMLWMVLVGIVVWGILNRHKFGAHVYLIGDNEGSARLMGVNVGLTRIMLFAIVGVAAAFAGVIQSVDNWYFWPNLGEGYLMQTLAAVFLGGTSVFGGTGSVFGTFVACFIIGGIQPGIVAVGLTGYYTKLIYGLIITASVAMHTILRERLK